MSSSSGLRLLSPLPLPFSYSGCCLRLFSPDPADPFIKKKKKIPLIRRNSSTMFSAATRVDDDRIELARPQKVALYCSRCNSSNTNFCYNNIYGLRLRLQQPQYFCRTFRRCWTEDRSLRNVPVGGPSRRNKRSSWSASVPASTSVTVAEGNCGVSNKMASIFDFIIRDKMPTAARSVKCGDADECSLLTSLQELFILNSSGDGGSDNPHSNRALKITTFAQTPFIGIYPQHLRKIYLASEVDSLEAILMMHDSQGINADGPMLCVFILDSAAPEHCTGDISQLSDYHPEVRPDRYLRGAGGTLMRVHGTGSIRNENFQVKGVLYVPGLNNQPNTNKTIFSVAKLNELGYNVLFNSDGSSSVIDNSKGTWNLKHEIIGKAQKKYGHFMLDYLRIPLNRDPVPMLEGPGLLKSLWNASRSVWSSITGHLSQRTTCAQRPPV